MNRRKHRSRPRRRYLEAGARRGRLSSGLPRAGDSPNPGGAFALFACRDSCGRQIVLDTTASSMERFAADLDGFSISVRGLSAWGSGRTREFPASATSELLPRSPANRFWKWRLTVAPNCRLAFSLKPLTGMGGTICSLQRATPLQGVVERLLQPGGGRSHERRQRLFHA